MPCVTVTVCQAADQKSYSVLLMLAHLYRVVAYLLMGTVYLFAAPLDTFALLNAAPFDGIGR